MIPSCLTAGGCSLPPVQHQVLRSTGDVVVRAVKRSLFADLGPDDLAGYDDFHPAVFLAACGSLVILHGHVLPESAGGHRRGVNALRRKIAADRFSALFGQLLIKFVAAAAVGVY